MVVKRSGVVEPFNRDKVINGVRKACKGRPVSEDQGPLGQLVEDSLRTLGQPEIQAMKSELPSWGRYASLTRLRTCASRVSIASPAGGGFRGGDCAASSRAGTEGSATDPDRVADNKMSSFVPTGYANPAAHW